MPNICIECPHGYEFGNGPFIIHPDCTVGRSVACQFVTPQRLTDISPVHLRIFVTEEGEIKVVALTGSQVYLNGTLVQGPAILANPPEDDLRLCGAGGCRIAFREAVLSKQDRQEQIDKRYEVLLLNLAEAV